MSATWLSAEPLSVDAPRALVWDAKNTSSLLVGRRFRAAGWGVDWLASPSSPWSAFLGRNRDAVVTAEDARIEEALFRHPLDAFTAHGDDQIRWILARWERLPRLHRFLPDREALEIALSKQRSQEIARRLGIPVLPTERCGSPEEVTRVSPRLSEDFVVMKGEGGSAGSRVRRVRAGQAPTAAQWATLTAVSPEVMVQRELRGPRFLVTVVFDRGRECAAVVHEKVCAFPAAFGVTAAGITRTAREPLAYARRFFFTLAWHGFANLELRQDLDDGRWYFMEANPRVPSSVGIQDAAGVDLAALWADVCAGGRPEDPAGYAAGVRYVWSVPMLARIATQPTGIPSWAYRDLAKGATDLATLPAPVRTRAHRVAAWQAGRELRLW